MAFDNTKYGKYLINTFRSVRVSQSLEWLHSALGECILEPIVIGFEMYSRDSGHYSMVNISNDQDIKSVINTSSRKNNCFIYSIIGTICRIIPKNCSMSTFNTTIDDVVDTIATFMELPRCLSIVDDELCVRERGEQVDSMHISYILKCLYVLAGNKFLQLTIIRFESVNHNEFKTNAIYPIDSLVTVISQENNEVCKCAANAEREERNKRIELEEKLTREYMAKYNIT